MTARARRRGLLPRSLGRALLLEGRAVHGFGLQQPLTAVGIDRRGRVVACRTLAPRRVTRIPSAAWILELPPDEPVPAVGSVLRIDAAS